MPEWIAWSMAAFYGAIFSVEIRKLRREVGAMLGRERYRLAKAAEDTGQPWSIWHAALKEFDLAHPDVKERG